MRIKKNISVVIQGPIDDRTYEAIDAYQDFSEVIVSTWEDQNIDLLKPAKGKYKLKVSKYPDDLNNYNNHGYRYFIAKTTLEGAKLATKPYVLKTRSDELYPNLDAIVSHFDLYPYKTHTTDNGFWKHIPFCYSNHLFIESKELLVKACSMIEEYAAGKLDSNIKLNTPEQTFGYYIMKARGFDLFTDDWKSVFRDNIFITPCSMLPEHLHSGGSYYNTIPFKRYPNYPWGRPDNHQAEHLYRSHKEIV